MNPHQKAGSNGRLLNSELLEAHDHFPASRPEDRLEGLKTEAERHPTPAANGRTAAQKLVINGRFLTQPLTGVQRYSREVVKAMDALVTERHECTAPWIIELHHPPGDFRLDDYRHIRIVQTGKRKGHFWEQLDLKASARDGLLLNLANTAPVLHPNVVSIIHDVGVFAHGSVYSASFRLSYRLMFRILVRRARRLLTVSSFSAKEIIRYCGAPAAGIAIAPNAADHISQFPEVPEVLDRLGLRGRDYVLAVGSRNPLKNLASVIRALEGMGPDRPLLVVVGQKSAAIFQNRSDLVEPGDQAGFIVATGEVSDGALRTLYRNAHCLVFPSFYEGFGIPPLEAMQEGCPVIASRLSAIPEVCGDAILYCDPHSPEDIAAKVAILGRDDALRRRLIEAGRNRSARFSWRGTALEIFNHLNELRQP
jgi:glycosyltransferase involved in cell wall biosynthesis